MWLCSITKSCCCVLYCNYAVFLSCTIIVLYSNVVLLRFENMCYGVELLCVVFVHASNCA